MGEGVPFWIAISGFVILAAIAIVVIPIIFPALRWYHVLLCYVAAPFLAFCNAYGAGLTDWNCSSTYGKLGLFLFAGWVGTNGGVIAGLAACGVMFSVVATAADLMQDLKTGHPSPCSLARYSVLRWVASSHPLRFGCFGLHSMLETQLDNILHLML